MTKTVIALLALLALAGPAAAQDKPEERHEYHFTSPGAEAAKAINQANERERDRQNAREIARIQATTPAAVVVVPAAVAPAAVAPAACKAESAILWMQITITPNPASWTPSSGFDSLALCQTLANNLTLAEPHDPRLSFSCFPASFDPRPKQLDSQRP